MYAKSMAKCHLFGEGVPRGAIESQKRKGEKTQEITAEQTHLGLTYH